MSFSFEDPEDEDAGCCFWSGGVAVIKRASTLRGSNCTPTNSVPIATRMCLPKGEENAPGEAQTNGVDDPDLPPPGRYRLVRKVGVGAEVEIGEVFAIVFAGEQVAAMEVVVDEANFRVRARIAQPAGWVTLLNRETGLHWAVYSGPLRDEDYEVDFSEEMSCQMTASPTFLEKQVSFHDSLSKTTDCEHLERTYSQRRDRFAARVAQLRRGAAGSRDSIEEDSEASEHWRPGQESDDEADKAPVECFQVGRRKQEDA